MSEADAPSTEGVGLNLPPPVVDPDDPLLIAQTLTYVTDDGSVLLSFTSSPFSFGFAVVGSALELSVAASPPAFVRAHRDSRAVLGPAFKLRFFIFEALFVAALIVAVPVGAHGTVVSISIGNLVAVAWFWYNSVRCVDITSDGGLRFWIGNIELDVPYDKIVGIHRLSSSCGVMSPGLFPHRGLLTNPTDGVAILTSVPSTPFWAWPRSAGRPERHLGPLYCPRLKIVFSPAGGGLNFIREVENEMHHGGGGDGDGNGGAGGNRAAKGGKIQPPSFDPAAKGGDFFDV
ncbi:hypothetical protein ACHAWF_004267 [Thalassiosira exigua]